MYTEEKEGIGFRIYGACSVMDVVEITEENLEDFASILGEDLSEDVKRVYYSGLGALDEEGRSVGALLYELFDSESEEDTRSRICLLKADDKEISDSLMDYYTTTSVSDEEITESFYETREEAEAETLSEKGFSIGKKQSDDINITLGELMGSELAKKKGIPDYVGSIENLSVLQFRDAVKQILFKGHRGLLEDAPYLPMNWYDNRVSACVSSGGKIPGLFLIRRTPSGVLIPTLFFAYGPECKKNLIYMINYSLQQAIKLYPPETVVRISRKDDATRALTDKLLPGVTGDEIFFGTREE